MKHTQDTQCQDYSIIQHQTMPDNTTNNKRIAKNTSLLFIRTLVIMFISLYTSRVILKALGVDDYGIYQVVGGVVTMFSVISSSLSTAISRFITFEIGRGDKEQLRKIFSTSVVIQLSLAVIIFVICEIIGIWFIETKMQIPPDRLNAANWVLHCSLVTFCINLLSVPYNACIIAHERMSAFAYIGIYEGVMKLALCYLIFISPIDKLVFYAIAMLLLALSTRIIYTVYCRKNFEESKAKASFNKTIFKEMLGFSGWSFFNSTAFILNNQGINMLMNIFFGVVVNAARGIAVQVETAVLQFVNNFTTAINPQITKCYAAGDYQNMYKLVCRGAKFSFFAMLLLSLPIILEAKQILSIWLVDVPDFAVIFAQLSLVMGMCDCIGNSGYTACMATGKLKKYSIIITSISIFEFPLAWIFFASGAAPQYAYYTYIAIKIAILIVRMFLLQNMIGLKIGLYIKNVFIPIIATTLIAIVPPTALYNCLDESIVRLILIVIISVVSTAFSALYMGMTVNEKNMIIGKTKNIVYKFIKHKR